MNKNLLIIVIGLVIITNLFAQVDTAWVRRYSGVGNFTDKINAICTDNWGNIYVAGVSYKATTDCDWSVIKYNANGELQWLRTYNGPPSNLDQPYAITVDNNGYIYVAGYAYMTTNYDFLTIKYNQNGDTIWTRTFNGTGNAHDVANAIFVDNFGNVYVTGSSWGNGNDILTIKYNSNGDMLWQKRYHGGQSTLSADEGRRIAVDGFGNIYVAGFTSRNPTGRDYIVIKFLPNGDTAWMRFYDNGYNQPDEVTAMRIDNFGNVYVTGFSPGSGTNKDFVTIKYAPDGTMLWLHRYTGLGAAEDDEATAMAIDRENNIVVCGYSNISGVKDWATIKYNSITGETLWVRRFDRSGQNDHPRAIAIDDLNNIFVTGFSNQTYNDITTIRYSPNGEMIWCRTYHGPVANQNDDANAICVDKDGNVIVGGYSFGVGSGEDFITIKYYTEDVTVNEIIQPVGDVDSASVIVPQVKIKNLGNRIASFNAKMTIPSTGYMSTKPISNLAPFDSTIVNFDPWLVGPRGLNSIKCSTEFALDMIPSNDKLEATFTVQVRDFSVNSVSPIPDPIDSTAVIVPNAVIENLGSLFAVNVPVVMKIEGTTYCDTQFVSLAPNNSILQNFSPFALNIPRGNYSLKCSTHLTGDLVPHNNASSVNFSIRVRDCGVSSITSPSALVDSNATITPKAWIHNYGTVDESNVSVFFFIDGPGLNYSSSRTVSLAAGSAIEQTFDNFVANLPLATYYTMRCSVNFNGDMVASNNVCIGTFGVQLTDVGVIQIISPIGVIDSAASIAVQAVVKNYGTQTESFNVTVQIDDWQNTKVVSNILPHSTMVVNFDPWPIGMRGSYNIKCFTQLSNDPINSNDTMYATVTVRVSDLAVIEIIQPIGTVDSTAEIIPKVLVKNCGTETETFNVSFKIVTWLNTQTVYNLSAGAYDTVIFDPWTVIMRGNYPIQCSLYSNTDMVSENNVLNGFISIGLKDLAVERIIRPRDTCYFYAMFTPKAMIYNYGTKTEYNVPITFTILNSPYQNTKYITIASGESLELAFDSNQFNEGDFIEGQYYTRCSIPFSGDLVIDNNVKLDSFILYYRSWKSLKPLPIRDLKGVKAGGAMTTVDSVIYALRGRNTCCFYAYDIAQDSWTEKCSVPILSCNKIKKVKNGAAMTAHNGLIYAFKGNSTRDFYTYDPTSDSWIMKSSIPAFASGSLKETKVKAGGALVTCGDYIYAFKGGNTDEFWMYDINADTWIQKRSITTPLGKKVKAGGALTAKGCTIYAFVGNNSKYFYSYLVAEDSWIQMRDVSFGRIKKTIKDGAALVVKDDKIFAFKGGNNYDFGYYSIPLDTWITLEIVPGVKKVSAGGAMVAHGAFIYAIKGNDTKEFWRYTLASDSASKFDRQIQENKTIMSDRNYSQINPTLISKIVKNSLVVNYCLPTATKVQLTLYDVNGRFVANLIDNYQNKGDYCLIYKLKDIAKGIYLLHFETAYQKQQVKVVIY
ncbi:MAG: SBBP repeat-containing protein [candidate division WOR-3 bacterium]